MYCFYENGSITKAITEQRHVVIYAINGYQIKGTIINHDDKCVLVNANGKRQIVYKHAISTIELN